MNRLGEKSLRTLEYFTVLDQLAAQTVSARGREMALALRPVTDREDAALYLGQTTDAKDMMVKNGSPTLGGIRDVTAALRRCEVGGVLNMRELLDVASLLQAARLMLAYFAEQEEKTTLTPIYRRISGNRSLEEAITTSILSEEEMADGASPELASIRREMRRIGGRVRETLGRMISGERAKYLQEAIITQRNGRFVVPVKAEHRGDVPGLVHDTSGSGATVFIEPAQVVEINNQLKVLEGREQQEIERILAELSAEVAQCAASLREDYEALCTFDFIFARAKLSFQLNACEPNWPRAMRSTCTAPAIRCLTRKRPCPSTLRSAAITTLWSSPAPTRAARPCRSKRSACCASWPSLACISQPVSCPRCVSLRTSTPTLATSSPSNRACPPSHPT